MNSNTQANESFAKLKACIFYACEKQDEQKTVLDNVKLNKVLWYSDTAAYLAAGKPITSSRYIRKPKGPVAKYANAAIKALVEDRMLSTGRRLDEDSGAWLETYEVVHLAKPDRDEYEEEDSSVVELTEPEKAFVDRAFKTVCLDHDSKSISERTHGEIWNLARDGEIIPLYAIYAERLGKITATHIRDLAPR